MSIFGLMQDDKYQHFNTVLDIYITKHFSAMLAHRHVLLNIGVWSRQGVGLAYKHVIL